MRLFMSCHSRVYFGCRYYLYCQGTVKTIVVANQLETRNTVNIVELILNF